MTAAILRNSLVTLGAAVALVSWPVAHAADGNAAAAAPAGEVGAMVDASGPEKLIKSAADAMLADLDAHRAEYRRDPHKVNHLVDTVLLPHFDTNYAARLVLGLHWREASESQRKRFVDAYYKSMLNAYGSALVDFTANRLKVFPYTGSADEKEAVVRTQVRKSDGSPVEVDYRVHSTDDGWKAWDVIIEGISYVKSYKEDFGTEIDQKGLDAVIRRLEAGAAPAAVHSGTKSGN